MSDYFTDQRKTTNYTNYDRYEQAAMEDRSAPRVRLTIPATLRPTGGHGFNTRVNDLSLGGFSADCVARLNVGTLCWLKMPGLSALQCEVIWWQDNLVGCAFANLLSPIVYDDIVARYRNAVSRQI